MKPKTLTKRPIREHAKHEAAPIEAPPAPTAPPAPVVETKEAKREARKEEREERKEEREAKKEERAAHHTDDEHKQFFHIHVSGPTLREAGNVLTALIRHLVVCALIGFRSCGNKKVNDNTFLASVKVESKTALMEALKSFVLSDNIALRIEPGPPVNDLDAEDAILAKLAADKVEAARVAADHAARELADAEQRIHATAPKPADYADDLT